MRFKRLLAQKNISIPSFNLQYSPPSLLQVVRARDACSRAELQSIAALRLARKIEANADDHTKAFVRAVHRFAVAASLKGHRRDI